MRTFTAYIEYDPKTNSYVGIVPGLPGTHSVGDTLDELHANLKEVLELVIEEYEGEIDDLPHFVGVQQIEIPT
jgi:predicted RNase H-like HicB family nuclease